MSSATAAPSIVAPSRVDRALYCFNTATDIETEVAEKITPINSASNIENPKTQETNPITITGIITPEIATMIAGRKYFLSRPKSLSSPPKNINMITPISENALTKLFKCIKFKIAGPNNIPTNNSPITEGIPILLAKWPAIVVVTKIKHNVPIKFITIPPNY